MNYADAREEIRAALDRIDIVDHHEHMGGQFREGAFGLDLPAFMSRYYLLADLTSAGLPAEFRGPAAFSYLLKPDHDDVTQQRWNILLPYLKRVKNTIYYRYLLIALRDLFDMDAEEVDEIDDWKALSDKIRDANKNSAEWASSVLDRTNIKHILLDLGWLNSGWWQRDRIPRLVEDNCFHRVVRCDPFVVGDQRFAEAVSGNPVYSFDQYLDALDAAFQVAITDGAKGLKSALVWQDAPSTTCPSRSTRAFRPEISTPSPTQNPPTSPTCSKSSPPSASIYSTAAILTVRKPGFSPSISPTSTSMAAGSPT